MEDIEVDLKESFKLIPKEIQDKAAMCAVCLALLSLHGVDDKKFLKRMKKVLREDVYSNIGDKVGKEVIDSNLSSVLGFINGVKVSESITKDERTKFMKNTAKSWRESLSKGFAMYYDRK